MSVTHHHDSRYNPCMAVFHMTYLDEVESNGFRRDIRVDLFTRISFPIQLVKDSPLQEKVCGKSLLIGRFVKWDRHEEVSKLKRWS